MPAQSAVRPVGIHDHRHGVPADVALDPPLDLAVAGVRRLLFNRDGVEVRRGDRPGDLHPGITQPRFQSFKQQWKLFRGLVPEYRFQHQFQRIQPSFLISMCPLRGAVGFRKFFFH